LVVIPVSPQAKTGTRGAARSELGGPGFAGHLLRKSRDWRTYWRGRLGPPEWRPPD